MTTNYTKINNAIGTPYTKVSPPGNARYGYGIYGVARYGNNGGTYTKLNKASGTTYTNIPKAN